MSERKWVDLTVAAEHVGVHPMTLRRWITSGRLQAYRAGPRLLRVDLNELNAMVGKAVADSSDVGEEARWRARIAGELAAAGYARAANYVHQGQGGAA